MLTCTLFCIRTGTVIAGSSHLAPDPGEIVKVRSFKPIREGY